MFYSKFVPFWDIRLVTIEWPWNPGSLKVIRTNTYQSITYDFLLTFHSNHWPILHHFRDKRRFRLKITNVSHPHVFCAPLKEFSSELGISARGQITRMMGLPGCYDVRSCRWVVRASSTIGYWNDSVCLQYLQPSGYNAPTWRTDGQTPADSKDCTYA